jgi:hypothetical protein
MINFFLVQCHQLTNPLIYNVRKLSKIKNVKIFIHVDKKVDISDFLQLESPGVFFIKNRVDVRWGGHAQINVALNLFKEIMEFDFDYASFISGDDLFYHSISDFNDFLLVNTGKEFIGVEKIAEATFSSRVKFIYPEVFMERNLSLWLRVKKKVYMQGFKVGLFKNKNKSPFHKLYKGSNWFTLTKAAITYIYDDIQKNDDINVYFKKSFCSDEIIFQSILMNSKFKDSIYKISDINYGDNRMSLRHIDWGSGPVYPKIFNRKDLCNELPADCFFIRKVDSKIQLDFLDKTFGK